MAQAQKAVSMAWFKRENFAALRVMFEDGHKLHGTYDEWLAAAEKGRKVFEAKGLFVICVDIDPQDFPLWCKAHGHKLDAKGRTAFAVWKAQEVIARMER